MPLAKSNKPGPSKRDMKAESFMPPKGSNWGEAERGQISNKGAKINPMAPTRTNNRGNESKITS